MNIETNRLFITELTMDMAQAVHENSLDGDNRRFVPDEVFETLDEARETVGFLISQYGDFNGPQVYAVITKAENQNIGYVQMVPIENGAWEIGYHIGELYTRRGYATEAVKAFLPVMAEAIGVREVYGICLKDNIASCRVLEKCGFKTQFIGVGAYQGEQREIVRTVWKTMEQNPEVYLFGQVLGTHSFLLKDGFLQPDEYSEIKEQYFLPGGETGTAATVLSSLGVSVRMDGTWIGTEVSPMLKAFYAGKKVDLSPLRLTEDDPGVMDYVVIAGLVRSPMGRFQSLFSTGKRWWSIPKEEDMIGCRAAAIDPYFGNESLLAAELCCRHSIPYVTIDTPHDSPLHRRAAVNVVSRECTSQHYPGMAPEKVMELMQRETDGLTIITQGGGEMLFARKGEAIHRRQPFSVPVKSTLGAGDTFKAGCVYGLLRGMNDSDLVRFASACSAIAISRFPLPLHPPRLEEVQELIETQSSCPEKID